jgi:hypothetical protein
MKKAGDRLMTTPVQRVSMQMKPQRHPLFASVVTVAAIGAMILLGGCGNRSIQTTQNNANQPGSSQTSHQGSSTSQSSSSATQSLDNLNNSINGSVNAMGNDQSNANTSASQSQEGEQQP